MFVGGGSVGWLYSRASVMTCDSHSFVMTSSCLPLCGTEILRCFKTASSRLPFSLSSLVFWDSQSNDSSSLYGLASTWN